MILPNFQSKHYLLRDSSITCNVVYPSLFLTNIRSLIGKLDEFKVTIMSMKPDIACVTETWLDDSIDHLSIRIAGYNVIRQDRLSRKGGGVMVYIRENLDFKRQDISELFSAEIDVIAIQLPKASVLLIGLYIPPSIPQTQLNVISDTLCNTVDLFLIDNANYNIIIMGDLNRFKCEDICTDLVLFDIVKQPTRGKNVLDRILISESICEVYEKNISFHAPIGNSDHLTITVDALNLYDDSDTQIRTHTIYDFRKSNLQLLGQNLSSIDWDAFFSVIEDVDLQCFSFNDLLIYLIHKCIPQRDVIMSDNDKEWLTPLTKCLIDQRWEAYRKKEWNKYNQLKIKVKAEIQKSKQLFVSKIKNDKQRIWEVLKQVSGKKAMNKWCKEIQAYGSADNLANAFGEKLEQMYRSNDDPLTSSVTSEAVNSVASDWNIAISEDVILKQLKSLSLKKSSGPDVIPTKIYRELAVALVTPLRIMFANSIKQQRFPSLWKHAIVSPIPKSTPADVNNFRPISVLSTQAKLFERAIVETMRNEFESRFGLNQHGFRSSHSTSTALIELYEKSTKVFEDHNTMGIAIMSFDMSSAFDSINHRLILLKFERFGFPTSFISWLSSYLQDRTCAVKIAGMSSRTINVERGVPQGSVLGPLIFNVFVSDINTNIEDMRVQYADDTHIVMPLLKTSTEIEIMKEINSEINMMNNWCQSNDLKLNTKKSKLMMCLKRNVTLQDLKFDIPQIPTMKILGVKFNNKLTWKDHINDIVKSCNRSFYILRKSKHFVSNRELFQLYHAIILSKIEYACPLFVGLPKTLSGKLERIQRRAFKIIGSNLHHGTPTVETRRNEISKKLFKNIARNNGHILFKYLPKCLQYSGHFLINQYRFQKRKYSFFPHVARLLNKEISRKYHLP